MKLSRILLLSAFLGLLGGFVAEPYVRGMFPGQGGDAVVPQPGQAVAPDAGGSLAQEEGKSQDAWENDEDFSDIFDIDGVTDGTGLAGGKPADSFEDAADDAPEAGEEGDAEDTRPRRLTGLGREDSGRRPAQEEAHKGQLPAAAWRHPEALEKRLAGRLRSRLKGTKPAEVESFLRDPENRLMLAQWEVLHRSDLKALGKLMRDRSACEQLSLLLNDLQWVASFAYDGELERADIALAMIHQFRQVDERMDEDVLVDGEGIRPGLKRRVAAAIAVEFTRNHWYGGDDRPLTREEERELRDIGVPLARHGGDRKDTYRLARERYLLYAEGIDQQLLNSQFARLPDWQLHFVCGWKGDSPFGTATTMRWLRDNVSAPAEAYKGMAYQVPYRASNVYGDSIHGPYYYQPFDVLYPGNFAKETRDVGAVCGGLSHFGASSANANGVPAITMGEPGHCAYAVYLDGKWHACNSISEERSPHWKIWGQYGKWGSLQMMSAMYEDGARTRDAQLLCSLAAMLTAHRNPNNGLRIYEMAAVMQPLNTPVWDAYIATAANSLRRQPRKWLGVVEFVCSAVAPEHPEMCAKFLTEKIYPAMLPIMRSDKQKLEAFSYFFRHLRRNEDCEWDLPSLLDSQAAAFHRSRPRRMELLQMVVEAASKQPEFGIAITWAVKQAFAENKRSGEKMLELVDAAAKACPDKRLLDAAVIRAAEEMGDIGLAQKYSQPYLTGQGKLPAFERPEGNLVSAGGMVQLGEYFPDQGIIASHCAALTEGGGHIRSEAGKHQPLTVVLPKPTRIGAIVIVPRGGAKSYRQWTLETSLDGKNWKTITKLPDASDKPCVRVVFKRNNPNARYIRVDSGEDQGVGIDFNAFLIYDNKKAR